MFDERAECVVAREAALYAGEQVGVVHVREEEQTLVVGGVVVGVSAAQHPGPAVESGVGEADVGVGREQVAAL